MSNGQGLMILPSAIYEQLENNTFYFTMINGICRLIPHHQATSLLHFLVIKYVGICCSSFKVMRTYTLFDFSFSCLKLEPLHQWHRMVWTALLCKDIWQKQVDVMSTEIKSYNVNTCDAGSMYAWIYVYRPVFHIYL